MRGGPIVEGSGVGSAVLLGGDASPRLMLRSTRGLSSHKRKCKMSPSLEGSFSRTRGLPLLLKGKLP